MKYVICLLILVVAAVMALIGSRLQRVDGSEWRVRPSQSGKTWIVFRSVGWGEERSNKRFYSREAAESFVRTHFLRTDSAAAILAQSPSPAPPSSAVSRLTPAPEPEADLAATRRQHDLDRDRALLSQYWAKAHESLTLAQEPTNGVLRLLNLRRAKMNFDQVRRVADRSRFDHHLNLAAFELQLRSSALSAIAHAGPENLIAKVGETPVGSVPAEVKVAVWSRDSGACIQCGSREQLKFDPVYSSTSGDDREASHIQLVCETCSVRTMKKRGR